MTPDQMAANLVTVIDIAARTDSPEDAAELWVRLPPSRGCSCPRSRAAGSGGGPTYANTSSAAPLTCLATCRPAGGHRHRGRGPGSAAQTQARAYSLRLTCACSKPCDGQVDDQDAPAVHARADRGCDVRQCNRDDDHELRAGQPTAFGPGRRFAGIGT